MTPRWARELGKALRTNGLRWNGRNIVGVGERPNLGNWWFNHPSRAANRVRSGVQSHGFRGWIKVVRESRKFN